VAEELSTGNESVSIDKIVSQIDLANKLIATEEATDKLLEEVSRAVRRGLTTEYANWEALSSAYNFYDAVGTAASSLERVAEIIEKNADNSAVTFLIETVKVKPLVDALSNDLEIKTLSEIEKKAFMRRYRLDDDTISSFLLKYSPDDLEPGIVFCLSEEDKKTDTLADRVIQEVDEVNNTRKLLESSNAFRKVIEVGKGRVFGNEVRDAASFAVALLGDRENVMMLADKLASSEYYARLAIDFLNKLSKARLTRRDANPLRLKKIMEATMDLYTNLEALVQKTKELEDIYSHIDSVFYELEETYKVRRYKGKTCYAINLKDADSVAKKMGDIATKVYREVNNIWWDAFRDYVLHGLCLVDLDNEPSKEIQEFCSATKDKGKFIIGVGSGRKLFLKLPLPRYEEDAVCTLEASDGKLLMECNSDVSPYIRAVSRATPSCHATADTVKGKKKGLFCSIDGEETLRNIAGVIAKKAEAYYRRRQKE